MEKTILQPKTLHEPFSAYSHGIDVDGANAAQLTRLGARSVAPFFHPSGAYVVFSSDAGGAGEHALYVVDAAGRRAPLRMADGKGFDRGRRSRPMDASSSGRARARSTGSRRSSSPTGPTAPQGAFWICRRRPKRCRRRRCWR